MSPAELSNHAVWSTISKAKAQLKALSDSPTGNDLKRDVHDKLDFISWILETSESSLIARGELEQISSAMNGIVQQFDNSRSDVNQLAGVDQNFARIVAIISYPRVRKIFRSEHADIISGFREDVGKVTKSFLEESSKFTTASNEIQSELTENQKAIVAARNSLNKLEARVDAQFEGWQTEFSAMMKQKIAETDAEFAQREIDRTKSFEHEVAGFEKQEALAAEKILDLAKSHQAVL